MPSVDTADSEQHTVTTPAEMNRLVEQHLAAEIAGDSEGAAAMYTDDVIHDDVGAPHGPLQGPEAAKGFTTSSRPTSGRSGWTRTTLGTATTSA